MKVALTCDHLLERTPVHSLLEMACSMFPDAVIFTLAHEKGKVLGPIELHSIRSSYLTKKVKTIQQLEANFALIPSAAKKLQIPCSFDLVIHFSTGLSHGISTCKESTVVTYLYENHLEKERVSFMGKVFNAYVQAWSNKFLVNNPNLLESIKSAKRDSELLRPFFKFEDFVAQNNEQQENRIVFHPGSLKKKDVFKVLDVLKNKNLDVVIVSEKELPYISSELEVLVNPCSGNLSPVFASAIGLIEGSQKGVPIFSLQALASGRPIYALNDDYNDQVLSLKTGSIYSSVEALIEGLSKIEKSNYDPKSLRSHAARYSQIRFKSGLMKKLKDIGRPVQFSS